MIHCSNKSWRIHCCKVGRNMIFPQKQNKRRGFAHVRSFKGAFHSRTFLFAETIKEVQFDPYTDISTLLTGAKRREWMGCWGLLG